MPNPFAPLLGFLGAVAVGGSKKRRRKKNKSNAGTNGTSTQRTSSRALDIIRIQRGLPRDQDPLPETDGEVAEDTVAEAPNGRSRARATVMQRPDGAPALRISKMIGTDTIGITTDGQRGFVGPQWWSRSGREMLGKIRRRYPDATPEEALLLLLKQAVPSVDWEADELPRGALMLSRRMRRLVEAGYMGREVEVSTPAVRPQEAGPPADGEGDEAQEAVAGAVRAPRSPMGMPFARPPAGIEGRPTPPVPPDIAGSAAPATEPHEDGEEASAETSEAGSPGEAQDGAQEPQTGKNKRGGRGGRRGGKKDRKAAAAAAENEQPEPQENAHDTPEGDGGGASGDSDAAEPEADAPSGG